MRPEVIAVCCIAVLFVLIVLAWLFRKRLMKRLRKKQELHVKEAVVEFKKAQGVSKPTVEVLSEGKETPRTKVTDKNHSFLTINRDLSDHDRSGMMSFNLSNNLKLDTVQQTEEADAAYIDQELEKELKGGTYIDTTSAKNSTKNSNKKEFFLEYRRHQPKVDDEEVSYEAEDYHEGSDTDHPQHPADLDPLEGQLPTVDD